MKIIAYTYDAATHCPYCARRESYRTHRNTKRRQIDKDEHGVWDGFRGHPVFGTDETSAQLPLKDGGCDLSCDTCHTTITPHYDNNEDISL